MSKRNVLGPFRGIGWHWLEDKLEPGYIALGEPLPSLLRGKRGDDGLFLDPRILILTDYPLCLTL